MKVRIREFLEKVVEADSVMEVAEKYANSEIVLTADDFRNFEIAELEEREEE